MNFGQLGSGFGWQQGPSLVARLIAMRALRAETANGSPFVKAETAAGALFLRAETDGHD
jgi:hypothetical protein